MTPDAAVSRLAEIIASRSEFSEDEIYSAMIDSGVTHGAADLAYKFTQIAWSRVFLDGMGIEFSPDYICFNGNGEVVESGKLDQQPYFIAAMALARRRPRPSGMERLALMSADLQAINDSLNAGSKPENIRTGPAGLFMEPATQDGIHRARHILSNRLLPTTKKPWWRFW